MEPTGSSRPRTGSATATGPAKSAMAARRSGRGVDFQMWEGQPVDIFVLANPTPPQRAAARAGACRGRPALWRRGKPRLMPRAVATSEAPAAFRFRAVRVAADRLLDQAVHLAGRAHLALQFWLHGVLPLVVCSILLGWIPVTRANLVSLAVVSGRRICISFKRFHDLGYPGWWSLLYIIPMLLAALLRSPVCCSASRSPGCWRRSLWAAVLRRLWIVQMALVYLHVGQAGPNEYGPDPLARA